MDGEVATKEIRKSHQSSNLPIVAMTANAMQSDRDRCIVAGMNDFVSKPIDPTELWKALLKWIPVHTTRVGADIAQGVASTPISPVDKASAPIEMTVIDIDRLTAIFGKKTDSLQHFLNTFTRVTQGLIEALGTAIQNKSRHSAKDILHNLKGSCGTTGAKQMYVLTQQLDALIEQENWVKAETCFDEFKNAFLLFKTESKQYWNKSE